MGDRGSEVGIPKEECKEGEGKWGGQQGVRVRQGEQGTKKLQGVLQVLRSNRQTQPLALLQF